MTLMSGFRLCALLLGLALPWSSASAQAPVKKALKNGETLELFTVYSVARCRSIIVGKPKVEVLEGASELDFAVKSAMVMPRNAASCTDKVPGGIVTVTAKGITEEKELKVTLRVNYMTKDGPRTDARSYYFLLFPRERQALTTHPRATPYRGRYSG
jgi:hypothetical protein